VLRDVGVAALITGSDEADLDRRHAFFQLAIAPVHPGRGRYRDGARQHLTACELDRILVIVATYLLLLIRDDHEFSTLLFSVSTTNAVSLGGCSLPGNHAP
jgi:hypothetical protein